MNIMMEVFQQNSWQSTMLIQKHNVSITSRWGIRVFNTKAGSVRTFGNTERDVARSSFSIALMSRIVRQSLRGLKSAKADERSRCRGGVACPDGTLGLQDVKSWSCTRLVLSTQASGLAQAEPLRGQENVGRSSWLASDNTDFDWTQFGH